jgi:hypothetical protein
MAIDGQEAAAVARDHFTDEFGVVLRDATEGPVDAVTPSTGAGWNLKSAVTQIKSGENGRFTFWEDDHDPNQITWYAFAVYNRDMQVIMVKRMKFDTVTEMLESRGGWNTVNHRLKPGRRARVAWPVVIEEKWR